MSKKNEYKNHQDVLIVGSKLYDILELIGVILHSIVLFFGILTLTGIFISDNHMLNTILESVTFLVIFLIILHIFLFEPLIKRRYIYKNLKAFWGVNKIQTITSYPIKIIHDEHWYGKIIEEKKVIHDEIIKIHWDSHRPLANKLYIQTKFENYNVKLAIDHVILDFEENIIYIDAKLYDLKKSEVVLNRRLIFNFYLDKKFVSWSGIFPDHPFYGEWIWPEEK